jgi:hypothetical protein
VLRVRGLRGCSSAVGRAFVRVFVVVRPRDGRTGDFDWRGGSESRGVMDLCRAGAGDASDSDMDPLSTAGEVAR